MPDPEAHQRPTRSAAPVIHAGSGQALSERVEAHLTEATGGSIEVVAIEPLSGGACQDNYRVDVVFGAGTSPGRRSIVLRSDSPRSLPGSLDRRSEAAVIEAAVSRGVMTPRARWFSDALVRPGASAYFLDWVDGTAIGRQVVKLCAAPEASTRLAETLAVELTKIHAITAITHPHLFESRDRRERTDPVGAALVDLRRTLDGLAAPKPALELAFEWLARRPPEAREVTLVHGDFRNGNFMVRGDGLSAILDWEFSHFGSPFEDLAWIAVRDWRFGELKKPIGGFARREVFYEAYRRASGRELPADRLHWWEVFGNVRWAAGAWSQGERYYAGDRDLELIVIARRAPEMEYEALRLIERAPDARPS